MLAPDLAAVAVLVLAARGLGGADLVKAVFLAGIVLLVRRGAAGAWLGRDPASPDLATSRRRTRRGALRWAFALAVAGVVAALADGGSPLVGLALGFSALAPSLLALEHQALRSCARRGQLLASATAGAGAALLAGLFLMADDPPILGPLGALAAGDIVALAVAWHRRHGGTCHAVGQDSSTPLEANRRPPASPATASVLLGAMHLLPLALVFRPGSDDTLYAGLVVVGLLPLVAAGTVPVLVIPGLTAGRRETVVPALLLGATLGALATLAVMADPQGLLALPDHRLAVHAAYFCVAMAMLGLGQVLLHHRVGTGNDRTGVILVLVAGAVEVALVMMAKGPPAEIAVNAALGGTSVLLVSLAVATAVAAPFAFVFTEEDASAGPRLVGPALLAMVGLGLAVRLASFRPIWLDEAATGQLARGPFSSMLDAAEAVDAHPPLQTVFAWGAKQALGNSAFALRLPSLVVGVLLIPLLYVTGKELYGRRTGLAAAAVAAFAPALIWFSVAARPPALAAFLAVATLLTMVRALRWRRGTDWVLFGVSGAALMWTHQLAFVHLLVLNAAVALTLWGRRGGDRRITRDIAGWLAAAAIVAMATVPLLLARSGLGPPRTLPPFEFATPAAPAGGVSVFAALGTGVQGFLGFHPATVTSRLLALWPLGIVAVLLVLGRSRSRRGVLLLALGVAPFVALLVARLVGSPRSPPLALDWAATAVPFFCLVAGRGVTALGGQWSKVRALTVGLGLILAIAIVDQAVNVKPIGRFDVTPVVSAVGQQADRSDLILYEPRSLSHLVAYEAQGTEARPVEGASPASIEPGRRVYIIGAFALGRGQESVDRAVALVKELAATRPLLEERRGQETTVWVFG